MTTVIPLSKSDHADLKFRPLEDLSYIRNQHLIPIYGSEIAVLCRLHPLVISRQDSESSYGLSILCSLGEKAENVSITPEGKWLGPHVPACIRQGPFTMLLSNDDQKVVYVDIEQDPSGTDRIPPGLFVRGEITSSSEVRERWVVPRRSIHDDRILVARESTLRSIPVTVAYSVTGELAAFGLPDHDWAVLDTALTLGDFLVVDPGSSLRDGMQVRPILAQEVSLK